ncbi:MAG: YndJ family transporter [Archangium sp.]|nr:YndJ family transporter [Archangium sp.]
MVIGELMIPVMNAALVTGVAFVLPIALRDKHLPWTIAAASVAVSLSLEPGRLAALCVAPWLLLTIRSGVLALLTRTTWLAMAAGFAGTAALALITSRLEVTLFDIHEPIVKLTALHFTYAGAGTLTLALRVHEARRSMFTLATLVLVFIAPPVVATGFITRLWPAQVGGAVLMSLGVYFTAGLQLRDLREEKDARLKALWLISCVAPVIAMVLGVAWAAAQYWPSIPALTVPDMVPTHGALNAFGFVLCGHLAWWLAFTRRQG